MEKVYVVLPSPKKTSVANTAPSLTREYSTILESSTWTNTPEAGLLNKRLLLSSSFRCDQIYKYEIYYFGPLCCATKVGLRCSTNPPQLLWPIRQRQRKKFYIVRHLIGLLAGEEGEVHCPGANVAKPLILVTADTRVKK